jgi:hypothetical protein
MDALEVVTQTGESKILEGSAVDQFRTRLRGELLLPRDNGYEQARKLWNAMIDKRPAFIARCAGPADVVLCVHFARSNNLLVAVRGGGHGVAGKASCERGLMIDLSKMKGIRVDPVERIGRAEAGVIWGEFDFETQAFGLATTGGFVPSTGIAGLTLGGGLGYLMRRFGLACDNLLSVDIVTADGQLLTANAQQNEDLFWGVRGGGGNFGIVTSFKYKLHPVGPIILGGLILHPLSNALEVGKFYREFTSVAPEELTLHLLFLYSPEGQPVAAFVVCYSGPLDQGEEVIRPLREFGSPVVDMVQPMPYAALQALAGEMFPTGRFNYWKSSFVKYLNDESIEIIVSQFAKMPSPLSSFGYEHLGGAMSRIDENDTAFGDRKAPYSLTITSEWIDPADSEKNIMWAREFWNAMQPFMRDSVYVNYLDTGEEERVKAAYGRRKYEKLVGLKMKYDPTNFFRLNHNIKPQH